MISFGTMDLAALSYGDIPIAKLSLGSVLVWESGGTAGATLTVGWNANYTTVEDGFYVRTRKTSGGGVYTLAATRPENSTSATLTGLDYGTSYDVTVASFNEYGEYSPLLGPYSRYTPPEFAPAALTIGTITSSSIAVSFTAAAGVTKYQGYYRAGTSGAWIAGPAITSGTTINFTGLANATSYQFAIKGYFTNPAIDGVAQTSSYSPLSSLASGTTDAEVVSSRYIDALSAMSLPPLAHWPLASNANSSLNGEYFDGTATNVSFDQQSVLYEGGRSSLFNSGGRVILPTTFTVEVLCVAVVWFRFDTLPSSNVTLFNTDRNWGVLVADGNVYGFVNGAGFGDGTPVIAGTNYCAIVMRQSSGLWYLYLNGSKNAYSVSGAGAAGTASIGLAANTDPVNVQHVSLHYNGSVAPTDATATAIYAAR